jgi:hypothetical protein
MVLDPMAEQGDVDDLNTTNKRFGEQIRAIRSQRPRRAH